MAFAIDTKEPVGVATSDPLQLPIITKFKIALCQLIVTPNKKENIENAHRLIEIAVEQGARLVVLPEMWNCPYSTDYFAKHAEDFDDEDALWTFSMLSEVALLHKITIIGGSMPEWSNGHLYNTCCIFGPDGRLKAKHRKIHLFDIDIPGEISFKESDTFKAGDEPTIVDTDLGRIGIGICHDIRFPELAMLYREKGVHLICYPGAFNMSTGELLWELEQRARAVDNQLFVATCSPARDSCGSYTIWGHSTLVGPSGEIIATSGHQEAVVVGEVDYSKIKLQRKSLPLNKQMRRDIYKFVNKHEQNGLEG
ncbi:Carbon-nitrogen hydrolase [Trema orientale]|uniref:Carbon-nitrogen hydrolase n=1 Tax=Trema orientale TaxID=63057 RepID=A0A2P5FEL6_TREOI|nr:Carbon-nitrogen hydrolase [Trema orientale]